MIVNVLDAKTNLSNLIKLVEEGAEREVIIARYNKPVATLTAYQEVPASKRLGIASGEDLYSEDIDWYDDEIAEMFEALK